MQTTSLPQPGLDQLPTLVDRVRGTGMAVECLVIGTPKPLPQGVDLAAYRVVQEGLTNTVKHAVGASARVCVEIRRRRGCAYVTDAAGGPARTRPPATGAACSACANGSPSTG